MAEALGWWFRESEAYYEAARSATARSDFKAPLSLRERRLAVEEKLAEPDRLPAVFDDFGIALRNLGQSVEALRYRERALAEALAGAHHWRAIHFACHGFADAERPGLSWLALSPDRENDGYLTAQEVMLLHARSDLVVLSACETAGGKVYAAEGVLGLTRSFLSTSAPRVICSLWKVDDEATRALMTRFCELWNPKDGQGGLGAAAALKAAQAFVRSREEWRHPRYWAGWVLWGLPD